MEHEGDPSRYGAYAFLIGRMGVFLVPASHHTPRIFFRTLSTLIMGIARTKRTATHAHSSD